ncbi:MAG: hypothetical protein IT242_04535 [Bacteroidia bacterium]|nr:hypothetical protein [Bacteroidia bacterium]
MKRFKYLILLFSFPFWVSAQEAPEYLKNSVSVDIAQTLINELNLSYEHYLSPRRSIELSGSLVFTNPVLEDMMDDWSNTHYFSEHGFVIRAAYKLYKRKLDDSKWREFIAPVIMYKNLYFNEQWFQNSQTNEATGEKYKECLYQSRKRSVVGIEFIWGKIYDMSKSTAFEFYYGLGLHATSAVRKDIKKQDVCDVTPVYDVNYTDNSFYFRPTLRGGIKFRFSF